MERLIRIRIAALLLGLCLLVACTPAASTQTQTPAEHEQVYLSVLLTATIAQADTTPIATVSPSPTPEPTPQPYLAKDGVYTIAWMSDTQHYANKFPESYLCMTAFLRDHKDELHLQYVIHTGDLVNDSADEAQWQVAIEAQSYLDGIPNGVLAGNHDQLKETGLTPYKKYFGEAHYADCPWYGGSFEDNRGHFDLLTMGSTDYVFVYMSYGLGKGCVKWINQVFAAYPNRVGVLCLHDYYTKTQTLSEDGQTLYDSVVKTNPNLYMVLCGHKYGAYCFPEQFDDDGDGTAERTVYQMLFNYQALDDGGGGFLRLMQIDEQANTLHVMTYSPLWNAYNRFADPAQRTDYYPFDETHEDFTLPLPWKTGA